MHLAKYNYKLFKGRWGISITIYGEVIEKKVFKEDCIVVRDNIYLSFSKDPLIKNELFCEEDRNAIFKALNMVAEDIVLHTQCHDGIVIQICSLQYDVCCYQEEAMVVAMLNWCSQVFGFKLENIESIFDNSLNKYVFEFSAY